MRKGCLEHRTESHRYESAGREIRDKIRQQISEVMKGNRKRKRNNRRTGEVHDITPLLRRASRSLIVSLENSVLPIEDLTGRGAKTTWNKDGDVVLQDMMEAKRSRNTSRSIRMKTVEIFYQLGRVFKIGFGFPGPVDTVRISFPLNQILKFSTMHSRVQDLFNLVFFFVIDEDGWWSFW
jgi:hypothetical protein